MRSKKFLQAEQAAFSWDVPGLIAGVDEAGRGPLAGPVVCAAVVLPGEHSLQFGDAALGQLAPGEYAVVLEAAREVGGRELVKVPFVWPPKGAATTQARGQHELGAISVTVKP